MRNILSWLLLSSRAALGQDLVERVFQQQGSG